VRQRQHRNVTRSATHICHHGIKLFAMPTLTAAISACNAKRIKSRQVPWHPTMHVGADI
jgi:hypothetical protein